MLKKNFFLVILGILAMALATKKTLQESLCLYFKMKEVAFTGSRPYASEPFENILKETFGAETTMSSIQRPKYEKIISYC